MSVEDIINKINELLTIDNAKQLMIQAKENAPSREEINNAVAVMQDTLNNIKQKSVQGASSVSTIYQKVVKSPQIEALIARIYKSKTPEERQRELEKILYLYLLKFGVEQTPPVDIDVMSTQETDDFFKKLLTPDTPAYDAVREMVRNLMFLFFSERMGVSVVEYGMEFTNKEMDAMYKTILDERRMNEINDNIEKELNNKEFMEFFLKQIIKDIPEKVTNDAKYFGHSDDYAKHMRTKVNNFIKGHNSYVSTYLKDGATLGKEVPKLDRLVDTIQGVRGLVEDKYEIDELLRVLASLRAALVDMVEDSKGDEIRVYEFKPLGDILGDDSVVIKEPPIVKPRQVQKKRAQENREELNEERGEKRARTGSPVAADEEQIGGRRRRTKKAHMSKKKKTMRRKRKGGARKSHINRKKGTTKRKRAQKGTKRR